MAASSSRRWSSLDAIELDNLVVASLADSFRTEIGPDVARAVGKVAPHELTSILVFAPRLWHFGHRHSLSLRHPRMSFATWAHRIRGGKPLAAAYDSVEVSVPPAALLEDRYCGVWTRLAAVHKALLDNCPELDEARIRIVSHPGVRDAIKRIWKRLVDVEPPSAVSATTTTAKASASAPAASATATDAPNSPSAAPPSANVTLPAVPPLVDYFSPGGAMTPKQFMYFEVRVAQTLLPDMPLASLDLLEIFERDMLLEMHRPAVFSSSPAAGPSAGAGTASGAEALGDLTTCSAYFNEEALTHLQEALYEGMLTTNPSESAEVRNGATVDHIYGARYQEHIWPSRSRGRDYRWLGNVTFEAFFMSLIELSDNWTSTSNPLEHAAFLFDLYEKIFTLDWSADADAVLVKAASKQKVAMPPSGVPVYATKGAQSSATAMQRRIHRKESAVQLASMLESTDNLAMVDLSMAQVMQLPSDIREGLIDGTSAAVVTAEEEAYVFEQRRVKSPVVEVRFKPQLIFQGENDEGNKVYSRGTKTFRTLPRMLFTLTVQPDVVTAVSEAEARTVPQSESAKRNPHVRISSTPPAAGSVSSATSKKR